MNLVGKTLSSRYEILEKIGEGGMAVVYKARCHLLNRNVAIKVLKDEYAKDETFVKRFRTEAQSAAALTHPNIVSVYDVGEENGINYIVMELLETKTLKDYIEEHGALSSELTLKIAAQIASALEAAHKAHIIHRDIKPHNIVLNKNLVAKVTDFGIAKITNAPSATITSFGSTMGSVHYFSPEHAKGGYTDEKSDIYSLGVVMYEMATGKLPFDGDSPVSVALKHIQEEPKPPIEVNPSVTPALNSIILKAMAKSTVVRYQSATELLRDISMALLKPNSLIVAKPSSVEAGATQVIPTISENEYKLNDNVVPNLRIKSSRGNMTQNSTQKELDVDKKKLTPEQKKKRKIIIISVCVVVAIIVISLGVFFGIKIKNKMDADKEANREIEVPDLKGKVFEEVVEEYKAQGIEILQDSAEYSNDVEEGKIISQNPENGTKTKDKKIYVVVSRGQKMVDVTDVEGKDSTVAKYELEETAGFKVEIEEQINEKIAAGIVISQEPKGGTQAPSGSTIKLIVSKGDGKATVLMPNVVGKTEEEAKQILTEKKLTVNVKTGEDKNKTNGVVIAQNYPENQELKEGSLVEITINKLLITKNISIDLLELQGGTPLDKESINVKVTASVDGGATNQVFDKTFKPEEESTTFSLSGYTNAVIKIYLDGNLAKEETINF